MNKISRRPHTITLGSIAVFTMVAFVWTDVARADAVPGDRVVVMYFHRTQRCPTCKKMGSYSEEAVKSGFAQQIKDGKVEFHNVDFQSPKNAALAKGYKISGPALIVAKVGDGKVATFENLKDIWAKVGDKRAFVKYVQENVQKNLTTK